MSHGIVKPVDRLFSTHGAEWHGFSELVEAITKEVVKPILPAIIRGGMVLDMGTEGTADELRAAVGKILKLENLNKSGSPSEFAEKVISAVRRQLKMPEHQGLVADYRDCFPELATLDGGTGGLVPLHIPKNSYQPITNEQVWDSMATGLKSVDAKVTSCGTLEAGKKFFISAQLGDGKMTVNGEDFLANLNFITSHDGSLAMEACDSTVRIVCLNTLRWSREAAGDVGFKVYHTQAANLAMANLGELVNRILTGRADFKNQMEYLAAQAVSLEDARAIVLGYFAQATGSEQLATNSFNATDAILALFRNGLGNKGLTAYDLLNGATEYWTTGDGTGSKADKAEKGYKANFGRAADHKNGFCNTLLSGEDNLAQVKEAGRKADSLGKRTRGTK